MAKPNFETTKRLDMANLPQTRSPDIPPRRYYESMKSFPAYNRGEQRPAWQGNNSDNNVSKGMSDVVPAKQAGDDTVFGMDRDRFSQLAGALGSIIAPNTTMGNIGAAVSDFAGQRLARRQKLERENEIWNRGAEQRKLNRELTRAQIDKAGELSKHERQVKNFMEANPGKSRWEAEEAIANLRETDKTKTNLQYSVDAIMKNNPDMSETDAIKQAWSMKDAGRFPKTVMYDDQGNKVPVTSQAELEKYQDLGFTKVNKEASQEQMKKRVEAHVNAIREDRRLKGDPPLNAKELQQLTKKTRKVFETQDKADKNGWKKAQHPATGEKIYITKKGVVYSETDEKIGTTKELKHQATVARMAENRGWKKIMYRGKFHYKAPNGLLLNINGERVAEPK